ncbi:MAG: 16S rRNA (guanine(527)-N(7))-methyltransferase RsmG [Dehalococcoidia bacterium]|nr:16S rRNA (guanine(527)-N(7))-methyltransferase RsmG [Dehalococcoidia bacterium]
MRKLIEGVGKLGLELGARQVEQFELYYQELVAWNRKFNLTSITDYPEVEVKHFLDSLTVALALTEDELEGLSSIVDIGAGAGFPGVPLKILLGSPRLVLVESITKKTTFLQHLVFELGLDDVEVVRGRSEDVAHSQLYREQFALAVSRAVAALPSLVELALPFCRVGGKFVALKKGDIGQEVAAADSAITTLGGRLNQVKKIAMEEFNDERYLVILDKISPTGERYPRCSSMVKRRPL